ncbi:MAG: putative arabinose efflux permease, MFS family [Rhodobacteraceae bacterium HLUCCA24]|nr:MAG: putative arabinose efflux permease, MFS family [Rhodobacteraceae bacterium HLUCCA24]
MQRLAVGWVTWELTQSHSWLGLVAMADLFPTVFCSPVGGVIADRFDRRKLVLATQWASVAVTLCFYLVAVLDLLTPEALLGFVFVSGVIAGVDHPIRQSLIGDLVPPKDLGSAVALSAMTFNLARMIGPALGGPLLIWFGLQGVLVANAASYLVYIVCAMRFDLTGTPQRAVAPKASFLADIGAGLAYVMQRRDLLFALSMLLLVSLLLRPVFELLPAFAARLGTGLVGIRPEVVLSALTTTLGFGAFMGVLVAPIVSFRLGLRAGIWTSAIGSGLVIPVFLAVGQPLVVMALMGVFGCLLLINSVLVQMCVHQNSEPEYRGRSLSLQSMIFRAAPALGALSIGWFAERVGLEAAFDVAVAVWAVLAVVLFFQLRKTR